MLVVRAMTLHPRLISTRRVGFSLATIIVLVIYLQRLSADGTGKLIIHECRYRIVIDLEFLSYNYDHVTEMVYVSIN